MFLGIDLGTSSVKALLVDPSGGVRGTGRAEYPLSTPQPGWVEGDPEAWWRATIKAVKEAVEGENPDAVTAIGFSGQMHSLVLVDASGQPVRPAIIWADTRTRKEVERFNGLIDKETRVDVLGNPAAAGFTALSLMWVKEHEPEAYARARFAMLPKDFLRYRLTGRVATDATDASATLLFDVPKRRWSGAVVERLGLSEVGLPDLLASNEVAGELTREAAEALELPAGLPVVTGAGDQAAAAVGCGVLEPGTILITMGSGGQVFTALASPRPDAEGRVHLFCHAPQDRWHLLGAVQNVGLALGWVRELFGLTWEAFFQKAAEASPGADGLLFLPYLTGERTPHMDADARGVWWGLTLSHGPAEMVRAALEGTTFAVKDALSAVLETGAVAEKLVLTGGGSAHPLRRQLLADVLGHPLYGVDISDASAKGAAVLAGAPQPTLTPTLLAEPNEDTPYGKLFERYRSLHKALEPFTRD